MVVTFARHCLGQNVRTRRCCAASRKSSPPWRLGNFGLTACARQQLIREIDADCTCRKGRDCSPVALYVGHCTDVGAATFSSKPARSPAAPFFQSSTNGNMTGRLPDSVEFRARKSRRTLLLSKFSIHDRGAGTDFGCRGPSAGRLSNLLVTFFTFYSTTAIAGY